MTNKEDIKLIANKIKVFNNKFLSTSQLFYQFSQKHSISEKSVTKENTFEIDMCSTVSFRIPRHLIY